MLTFRESINKNRTMHNVTVHKGRVRVFLSDMQAWWRRLVRQEPFGGDGMTTAKKADRLIGSYTFSKQPVESCGKEVPGYKAIVCNEADYKPISVVTDSYEIIQPHEFAALIDECVTEFGAIIDTYGFLNDFAVMFASCKLPDDFIQLKSDAGDPRDHYHNFGSSFDRTRPLYGCCSSIRVVCHNTETASYYAARNKKKLSSYFAIKHHKNWKQNIDEMKRAFCLSRDMIRAKAEFLDALREVKIPSKREKWEFAAAVLESDPVEVLERATAQARMKKGEPYSRSAMEAVSSRRFNNIHSLVNFIERGKGNEGKTAADLFNGVTEFESHPERKRYVQSAPTASKLVSNVFRHIADPNAGKLQHRAVDLLCAQYGVKRPVAIAA